MLNEVKINFSYSSNIYEIKNWLNNLPKLCAFDFETASIYTLKEKQLFNIQYNYTKNIEIKRILTQKINSNGLSYPTYANITHLSIAWSDKDAIVLICKNNAIRKIIYNFLISTDIKQIWHNTMYDFKFIYYYTQQLPKDYIDTLLLAKSLLNDADNTKDKVGLKELMAYKYNRWALDKESDKDNFTLENMYNFKLLQYAATDACATYSLYDDIINK